MRSKYENIQLPAFVTFPKPPPIYLIKDSGTFYYVEGHEEEFELVSEAEDYILNELEGEVDFNAEELRRAEGSSMLGGDPIKKVVFEAETDRMIVAYTSQDNINHLKEDYYDFLDLDREYNDNPENWAIAYAWINAHPAFYHRNEVDDAYWEFCDGWSGKWENVYFEKNGDTLVVIEHGPPIDSGRTKFSHDPRLDATGATFEEAYIYFAKQVNKHFDIMGYDLGLEEEEIDYM